jgi:CheY-like chemotaxis protein
VAARPPALVEISGVRVLLVDDDRDALAMARDALASAGALVTAASSAADALAALDGQRFDVGILDVGMPSTDGYELATQIRSRTPADQGEIPLAALTAYARSVDRVRSLQSGFQLHLTKPIQPAELTAAVSTLAGRSRASR